MSTLPEKVIRVLAPFGSLASLLRNRDKVAADAPGKLTAHDLVAVTGRGICRQWSLVAGLPVDHGTVADEAAMITLHVDSAETPTPRWVVPGDSCTRGDDPGWRWHCIAGHGTTLADWERRPIEGAISGLAVSDHTHAISAVLGLESALAAKQAALSNEGVVSELSDIDGALAYRGTAIGGGAGALPVVYLRRTTDQSVASLAAIAWSEAMYGSASLWDAGTPSRLLAPVAGLYRAMVWLRSSSVTAFFVSVNGGSSRFWRNVSAGTQTELWSADLSLAGGDYVEVRCYGAGTVVYSADNSPVCTWQRIG